MNDATIIYVSSNKETPEFEAKTRKNLTDNCGNLPIISVTHKPVPLGRNIVVGDVGASGFNFCRQLLMACEAADTRFVISAESDCIYPAEYFTFRPDRDDKCYRNTNLYILPYKKNYFQKKDSSTFAQVINREYYIKRLKELFGDAPQWSVEEKNFPKERNKRSGLFHGDEYRLFATEYTCISFKTGLGMRKTTGHHPGEYLEIPYWGSAEKIRKEYL